MARWIIGYIMVVVWVLGLCSRFVSLSTLFWGFGFICLGCSIVFGVLWWLDEYRWRREKEGAASSKVYQSVEEAAGKKLG